MNLLDYLAPTLFFLGIASAIAMRLNRNQSSTLVLQKFNLTVEPQSVPQPTVEIVGRMQGMVAFALSIMGFSPITRFTISGPELKCQSSSLFGQRSQFVPLRCVTNLAAGVHKPISMLIWALLIVSVGCYLSVQLRSWAPFAIALVIGIVLVILYFVTKKFFIEIYSQGGPPISLLFKPNVLEGVAIDIDQALEVVAVIRDMIVHEGAGGAPSHYDNQFEDEEDYDYEATGDNDEDSEDHERQAQHWYSQARQYSNSGQQRLAVATLQQLIQKFPNTTAADQARRSLEKGGR